MGNHKTEEMNILSVYVQNNAPVVQFTRRNTISSFCCWVGKGRRALLNELGKELNRRSPKRINSNTVLKESMGTMVIYGSILPFISV